MYPDNSSLCGMLQYYDAFLWLHVGYSMVDIEARDEFISGFRWIIERPSFGFMETNLSTDDMTHAYEFKRLCEEIGVEFKSYKEDFSLTEEDVQVVTGLFTSIVKRLRCPSRSSGDLQMDLSES